ncbi:ribosome modulation factor [Lichenihabitans psoromatis]|uniref:ribosome modulation factor n=1 Tax=Lichenihabitans psoromatis TaxID=2528642 RepID=UPI003CCA71E7
MSRPASSASRTFEEGADARAAGQPASANPHCPGTEDRREWSAGWRATFDLDEDPDFRSERSNTDDISDAHIDAELPKVRR